MSPRASKVEIAITKTVMPVDIPGVDLMIYNGEPGNPCQFHELRIRRPWKSLALHLALQNVPLNVPESQVKKPTRGIAKLHTHSNTSNHFSSSCLLIMAASWDILQIALLSFSKKPSVRRSKFWSLFIIWLSRIRSEHQNRAPIGP